MEIVLNLSQRQAEAVLKAELSVGYGVRRSLALQEAEFRIKDAILGAQRADKKRARMTARASRDSDAPKET